MQPSTLRETIATSLAPRLGTIFEDKTEEEKQSLVRMFEGHVQLLSDFVAQEYIDPGILRVEFIIKLHRLLFPAGYVIKAVGNDGKAVESLPGEWRKQFLSPAIQAFSPVENVAHDFGNIIDGINVRQPLTREDVLRFYFDFLTVHPFGDANGTAAALVSDILCFRWSLAPLWVLNSRFTDKAFHIRNIERYENDKSLESLTGILADVDRFNELNPVCRGWEPRGRGL